MNTRPIETARDQDLRSAMTALIRAGQREREIASQTGTAVITWNDGRIVRTLQHRDAGPSAD